MVRNVLAKDIDIDNNARAWCGRQRRGNDKRQTTYFFLPKDINDVYSMCTAEGRKLCRVHQSAWQREVSRKIVLEWITLWKRARQWKVKRDGWLTLALIHRKFNWTRMETSGREVLRLVRRKRKEMLTNTIAKEIRKNRIREVERGRQSVKSGFQNL